MGVIVKINDEGQLPNYLNAYHCIGRSKLNVDTLIDAPEVSRMHAVIEWHQQQWLIRDLSSNGTWVNNTKLKKDSPHILAINDEIFFGSSDTYGIVVKDLSQPQNMLIEVDELGKQRSAPPIILSDYNLLPSDQEPEMALFYVPSKKQWYKEFIGDAEGRAFPLANLDILQFHNQRWQLKLNIDNENTLELAKDKLQPQQIKYRFNLSLDEEDTELTILVNEQEYGLHSRVHHYLTANLALHRFEDAKKGIDNSNQGWRLPEVLVKELGVDIELFTTHVHRARKQFVKALEGACDGYAIIERKGKKIRFSGSSYCIYKGNKLIANSEQNKMPFMVING